MITRERQAGDDRFGLALGCDLALLQSIANNQIVDLCGGMRPSPPASGGKAPSEMPAFQPYRGKPAVRNVRGDRGNTGIIRSPVRASIVGGGPEFRKAGTYPRSPVVYPTWKRTSRLIFARIFARWASMFERAAKSEAVKPIF
jgi:hypothetical protein